MLTELLCVETSVNHGKEAAMNRTDVTHWVLSACLFCLRLSQVKTLADLVAAATGVERVSLSALGRRLTGPEYAKHRIKRVYRFTSNPRIHASDAMEGILKKLLKRRKKTLLVSLDWTEIRTFHTLALCAVLKGRSVPLLWHSYQEWDFHKSQNNLEEGLLRLFAALLPKGVPVILLADRGFGRTELARLCQDLNLHYIIRIRPDVYVQTQGYQGRLSDYPVYKGICKRLNCRSYRK